MNSKKLGSNGFLDFGSIFIRNLFRYFFLHFLEGAQKHVGEKNGLFLEDETKRK